MTSYSCYFIILGCFFFFIKVFEKAMHSRLSHYLQTNNILVTEEHGLRRQISTANAAFRLTDSVFKSVDQKVLVGGIFFDLANAFNCLNHRILQANLHFCVNQAVSAH